jgi:hypothetical protein
MDKIKRLENLKAMIGKETPDPIISAQKELEVKKADLENKKSIVNSLKKDKIFGEAMTAAKQHLENTDLHIGVDEKEQIVKNFQDIAKNTEHGKDYHIAEKQVDSVIGAVNLNTNHRTNPDHHFDSKAQKQSVIDFMTTPLPMSMAMGGGAGSAHVTSFLELTDTPSAMGSTNQILAVTAGGALAFTSNPTFALTTTTTLNATGTITSGTAAVQLFANGNITNDGQITSYSDIKSTAGAIIAQNGNVESQGGYYLKGQHMSAIGSVGMYAQFDAGGYYNYFEDGLLIYQAPV